MLIEKAHGDVDHDYKAKINPNLKNKFDDTTAFGQLFYQYNLTFYETNGFKSKEHLKLMLDNCKNIDFHLPSIDLNQDQKGTITPIQYFIKRNCPADKLKVKIDDKKDITEYPFKQENWENLFGNY